MSENKSLFTSKLQVLSVPFLSFGAFLILYFFRYADNNRLTSWQWAFAGMDMVWFIPILMLGLTLAYAISLVSYEKFRPPLTLFFSSFLAASIFWGAPEVIVDVSRYFTQAKHLELYGIKYFMSEWGTGINAWTDLPLVPFLYGLIFKYLGESRIFIQIFSTILFSLTVVLTYLTGKEFWNEETGFFAGAMLLGIPYIFSQTPMMLVDIPTMFFLMLSVFTFIMALKKGRLWNVIASLSIFCAVFSKYSAWIMLSVLVIIFLIYLVQCSKDSGSTEDINDLEQLDIYDMTRRSIIVNGVFVALMSGIFISSIVIFKYDIMQGQINFLQEYQKPGLSRWRESFVSTFFYQVHPFISIAAVYATVAAIKKKDLRFMIIGWLILLIVVFQIRRSRYVLITFPMLTLMASYGIGQMKSLEVKRVLVSCIVVASIVVAAFAYIPFLQSISTVNLKNAGKLLNSLKISKVEVFTAPSQRPVANPAVSVPILDLFTNKDIVYYHDADFAVPFEKIKESPLRFTWEYTNPEYYQGDYRIATDDSAVAVIANMNIKEFPDLIRRKIEGYKLAKVFEVSTGRFHYSPAVRIYLP
jgi:asparagine N-glycosylation enzyme membrane subunit Stt3